MIENTPYQIKAIKILEERRRKARADHKAKKDAKKAMTARLKPIKRRIRNWEKRVALLEEMIEKEKLVLIKIRGGHIINNNGGRYHDN